MPRRSLEERALACVLENPLSANSLEPGPGLKPSSPKAALRRCCAAWQRAFDAYMEKCRKADSMDKMFAACEAGEAYRNAMPLLAGYEGVRDFIACAAHGILIGAFPQDRAGQLLYAAQVALASLRHEPKNAPIPAPVPVRAALPQPLPLKSASFDRPFPMVTSTE